MTDTRDDHALVAWLEQQINEDERVAGAVGPKIWHEGSAWLTDMLDPMPSQRHALPAWLPMITSEDIAHIARHDPARVLREVQAKRQLLADHKPEIHRCDGGDFAVGHHNCVIKRTLAAVYADRSGYAEVTAEAAAE